MAEHTVLVVVTVPQIDIRSFVLGAIAASLFWLALAVFDIATKGTRR